MAIKKYRGNDKEDAARDIRCPNGHKIAEAQGRYVVIKCRCKHLVKVDMNDVKNK